MNILVIGGSRHEKSLIKIWFHNSFIGFIYFYFKHLINKILRQTSGFISNVYQSINVNINLLSSISSLYYHRALNRFIWYFGSWFWMVKTTGSLIIYILIYDTILWNYEIKFYENEDFSCLEPPILLCLKCSPVILMESWDNTSILNIMT